MHQARGTDGSARGIAVITRLPSSVDPANQNLGIARDGTGPDKVVDAASKRGCDSIDIICTRKAAPYRCTCNIAHADHVACH